MNSRFYSVLGAMLAGISAGFILTLNCGRLEESDLADAGGSDEIIELAISTTVHTDIETLYKTITGDDHIKYSVLRVLPQIINDTRFSGWVEKESLYQGSIVQGTRSSGGPTLDRYAGLEFGRTVFIFKVSGRFAGDSTMLEIFDAVPSTYLENRPLNARIAEFLDAKYYEKKRIQRLQAQLDGYEFLIRMVPAVDGLDRAINAENGTDRLLGVVTAVGDAASFGLGSKIKTVRKTAQAVVLTAASVRLSVAAKKAVNGEADLSTGVDASLALLESALVGVTFVKLRIPPSGPVRVDSPEAARVIAQLTGGYEDDILQAGVSREVLESLGIPIRNLTKAASNTFESVFTPADIRFLEDVLRRGDYDDQRVRSLFRLIEARRGKPVGDKEKPVALLFEIMAQKLSQKSGKSYGEALNEVFRFDLQFAGNNTARSLRIPKSGASKPVAIHRVLGDIIANSPSGYPSSPTQVRAVLERLGYQNLHQYEAVIKSMTFYFTDVLPLSPGQVTRLYSVENLSGRSFEGVNAAIAGYIRKGTISTGTSADDVVTNFLPSNAERAILIEFLPSNSASKITPVTGYGDLAAITDTLQKSRGYSGAVPGEVIIVPGPNPNFRIIGEPQVKYRGNTEVINISVQLL